MPSRPKGYVESREDKVKHHEHACFNLFKSDSLPLDRENGDKRDKQCREIVYDDDLPTTSVIFVFFNEPLSPLYRSIHSVLNKTPRRLLKEIIVIDDGSDAEWTQDPLYQYLKLLPKIVFKRMERRNGLMTTRTEGKQAALERNCACTLSHLYACLSFCLSVCLSVCLFSSLTFTSLFSATCTRCLYLTILCMCVYTCIHKTRCKRSDRRCSDLFRCAHRSERWMGRASIATY